MKNLVLTVVTISVLLIGSKGMAQKEEFSRNDVRLSYGMTTSTMVALVTGQILSDMFIMPFDSSYRADATGYGAFTIQYQYRFSKLIQVGAACSFNPGHLSVQYNRGNTQYSTVFFASVLPRIDFNYVNKGVVTLYSGIALGASYYNFKNNYSNAPDKPGNGITFNYHINAIGIRVGKSISGFMEMGFGCLGMLNFGVSARL
jgi:hypothetical protein